MLPDTDCADDAADDHADDDGDDDDDAPRMLPFRLVRVTLALISIGDGLLRKPHHDKVPGIGP